MAINVAPNIPVARLIDLAHHTGVRQAGQRQQDIDREQQRFQQSAILQALRDRQQRQDQWGRMQFQNLMGAQRDQARFQFQARQQDAQNAHWMDVNNLQHANRMQYQEAQKADQIEQAYNIGMNERQRLTPQGQRAWDMWLKGHDRIENQAYTRPHQKQLAHAQHRLKLPSLLKHIQPEPVTYATWKDPQDKQDKADVLTMENGYIRIRKPEGGYDVKPGTHPLAGKLHAWVGGRMVEVTPGMNLDDSIPRWTYNHRGEKQVDPVWKLQSEIASKKHASEDLEKKQQQEAVRKRREKKWDIYKSHYDALKKADEAAVSNDATNARKPQDPAVLQVQAKNTAEAEYMEWLRSTEPEEYARLQQERQQAAANRPPVVDRMPPTSDVVGDIYDRLSGGWGKKHDPVTTSPEKWSHLRTDMLLDIDLSGGKTVSRQQADSLGLLHVPQKARTEFVRNAQGFAIARQKTAQIAEAEALRTGRRVMFYHEGNYYWAKPKSGAGK